MAKKRERVSETVGTVFLTDNEMAYVNYKNMDVYRVVVPGIGLRGGDKVTVIVERELGK